MMTSPAKRSLPSSDVSPNKKPRHLEPRTDRKRKRAKLSAHSLAVQHILDRLPHMSREALTTLVHQLLHERDTIHAEMQHTVPSYIT
jgi:hypothetical protein